MEDPVWAWPYWKFGLKRDDLFKLHDQYNTVPSSIQDPEAFHHDVAEISRDADTPGEFYRRLGERKQQRLRELNDSLESAALEIIANPSLIGTAEWPLALQLFRTKSLDSLVRYFASFLPALSKDQVPWPRDRDCWGSETGSSVDSVTDSHFFVDHLDDAPVLTEEPTPFEPEFSSSIKQKLPPSPRSMATSSESSVAPSMDDAHHIYIFHTLTPARTASISEASESGRDDALQDSNAHIEKNERIQPCDCQSSEQPQLSEDDFVNFDSDKTPTQNLEALANGMHDSAELPHGQPRVAFSSRHHLRARLQTATAAAILEESHCRGAARRSLRWRRRDLRPGSQQAGRWQSGGR